MKYCKQLLLLMLLFTALVPAMGRDMNTKAKVDVEEILWGHIKDSYEWHLTEIGGHPVVIHLPIIVKSSTGWHIFSSSEFAEGHGESDRPGPYNLLIKNGKDKKNPNKIVEKINGEEVAPFDISITKNVCTLFVDAIVLLLVILIPARWCKKHKANDPAPSGFTGLMHMFIMNVHDDVIKPCMGEEDTRKYGPWLLTCFFFIFFANLMGLVPFPPGGGNLTGNIACTCFFGVCTFLITNFTGSKEYWKEIFWPDVPVWMKFPVPLMPFIELFGIFTKPLALIIRLFANMLAGHAIALAFAAIIFIMFGIADNAIVNWSAGSGITVVSVLMSVFMMMLEILVSYIQALVFTMLSAVFIAQAHVKHHEA